MLNTAHKGPEWVRPAEIPVSIGMSGDVRIAAIKPASQACHFLTFGIAAQARAGRLVRVAASTLEHAQHLKKECLLPQPPGPEIKGLGAVGVHLQHSRA